MQRQHEGIGPVMSDHDWILKLFIPLLFQHPKPLIVLPLIPQRSSRLDIPIPGNISCRSHGVVVGFQENVIEVNAYPAFHPLVGVPQCKVTITHWTALVSILEVILGKQLSNGPLRSEAN